MLEIILLEIFVSIVVISRGAPQAPMGTIIIAEIPDTTNAIRPTTFQRCITPNKGLGQCMHLTRCPLPEFNTDKLRFMDYFCIIDRVQRVDNDVRLTSEQQDNASISITQFLAGTLENRLEARITIAGGKSLVTEPLAAENMNSRYQENKAQLEAWLGNWFLRVPIEGRPKNSLIVNNWSKVKPGQFEDSAFFSCAGSGQPTAVMDTFSSLTLLIRYVGVCCPDSFVYQMNTGQPFYMNPAGILPAIGNDLTEVHIIEIDPNEVQGNKPMEQPQGNILTGTTPQGNGTQGNPQQGQGQDSMKKIVFEERRGCGVNQNDYYSRVVGGRPADPRQWPWMVSLIRNREHFCGGVLITDRHILTAAHCLKGVNMRTITARLGEHDLQRIEETRTQDFRLSDMMIHKDFDANTYENDIAIIKMDRPARFNTYAWPICLPQPNAEFVDEDAIVIGWGAIEYGGPTSNILMEVAVPVWNNTKCDDEYLQPILDTNLCAGGQPGRDSCQGDSGGPLLYQLPNKRWITIGVVSWGIRCGEDRPAVYTKVSKYLDWILKNAAF